MIMMPEAPLRRPPLVHVTEVLEAIRNPALEQWRGTVGNQEANRQSQEARQIGTALHAYLGAQWRRSPARATPTPPKIPSQALTSALTAAHEWVTLNTTVDPIAVEEALVDPALGLTGTPDLVTATHVYDWKTSRQIRWEHHWQLNAYLHLASHHYGRSITQGWLVRFDKELATFSETPVTYSAPMWEAFCQLVGWYRFWKAFHENDR